MKAILLCNYGRLSNHYSYIIHQSMFRVISFRSNFTFVKVCKSGRDSDIYKMKRCSGRNNQALFPDWPTGAIHGLIKGHTSTL
jgi:hypothetical protein